MREKGGGEALAHTAGGSVRRRRTQIPQLCLSKLGHTVMGISGFFQVVRDKAPNAIEYLSEEGWAGKRLGIDAPVLLCRARASSSDAWSYLSYLVDHLQWLRVLEVQVLFVFDGETPPQKSEESKRRKATREAQAQEACIWTAKLAEASNWEEIASCRARVESHTRAAVRVGPSERLWMKKILDSCGASWCTAPHEAETFLASLQMNGHIDEIVTEDSDAIVCGANSILRNFWTLRRSAPDQGAARQPQRVNTETLLASLNIDAACMKTAAALAGCDFAPKLKNVGLLKALRAVAVHRTDVPSCLRALKHKDIAETPDQLEQYVTAVCLLQAPLVEGSQIQDVPKTRLVEPVASIASRVVDEAEAHGEPWSLREAFGAVLRKRRRIDRFMIVPSEWLSCEDGDMEGTPSYPPTLESVGGICEECQGAPAECERSSSLYGPSEKSDHLPTPHNETICTEVVQCPGGEARYFPGASQKGEQ